ncbi:MAG: D-alanine--D-alanine ligase [Herpetosiphonaceae bacterium]|nr:MAG: D-alanine--D-alanine ligase [Herpetosiphonaceae bacterium]
MAEKLRVGVIFGGRNTEHEVSLKSARFVMTVLDQQRYEVIPIGIDKQGRWLWDGDPLYVLEQQADRGLLGREPQPGVVRGSGETQVSRRRLPPPDSPLFEIDVAAPILHGLLGEDGTIQGLLEMAGIPYIGCGVLASAVGMDKVLMKAAFAAAGLPLLPWVFLRRVEWERDREDCLRRIESQLRYPIFTKPANAGSSVGVTRCSNRAELAAGLAEAARHDRRIIAEQGISAREIEVSVLGNDEVSASIPGEIVPGREWYDYADKYLEDKTQFYLPARLDEATTERVRELAIAAFKAIDGAGLSRVDFLLDRENGEIYINEINTLPGFTAISMYPKLWEATGLAPTSLMDRLVELALERSRDRRVRAAEVGQ